MFRTQPFTDPRPSAKVDLQSREIYKLNKEKSTYFCLFGIPIIKCSFTKTINPRKYYSYDYDMFEGQFSQHVKNSINEHGFHCTRYKSIFRIPRLRHLLPINIKTQTVIRSYILAEKLFCHRNCNYCGDDYGMLIVRS